MSRAMFLNHHVIARSYIGREFVGFAEEDSKHNFLVKQSHLCPQLRLEYASSCSLLHLLSGRF
jgi:hypothetical protein